MIYEKIIQTNHLPIFFHPPPVDLCRNPTKKYKILPATREYKNIIKSTNPNICTSSKLFNGQ